MEAKSEFAVEFAGVPPDSSDRKIAHGYARGWPRDTTKAVFEGCLAGLARAPAEYPASSPSARDLWERNFIVASVSGDRRVHSSPISELSQVRLGFTGERQHTAYWEARCNGFSGDVRFTATRLQLFGYSSTLVGCRGGREEEDDWLLHFLESEPEWRLEGTMLELSSDQFAIELRGFEDPDACPVFAHEGRIDVGQAELTCEDALGMLTAYAEGRVALLRDWTCGADPRAGKPTRVVCGDGEGRSFSASGFELDSLIGHR